MKTLSTICANFTTPKGSLQAKYKGEKNRQRRARKGIDKRVEKKKTDFPFDFYVVNFGEKKRPVRVRVLLHRFHKSRHTHMSV